MMPDQSDTDSFEPRPLWRILHPDFAFTKRQIGVLLLIGGSLGFIGLLALDVIGVGREGGIGPAQRAGLGVFGAAALLGLSLIPLGDMPA